MNTHLISIETTKSSQEVINKIKDITSPDISHARKNSEYVYYGEVSQHNFSIKNVRYGPMSSAPNIKGEVQAQTNRTLVKLDMDIKSNYIMVRNMYYSTLLPIGILVLIATLFVLGDTEYWLQGYLFSGSFIAFPFLVTWLEKSSLVNMRKKESENLASKIGGRVVPA